MLSSNLLFEVLRQISSHLAFIPEDKQRKTQDKNVDLGEISLY